MTDFWTMVHPLEFASLTRQVPTILAPPAPEVDSVVALDGSGTSWRVTFVDALLESPVLAAPTTYEIVGMLGHEPRVLAAVPQGGATPIYVDLTTEEHLDGETYTITVHGVELA